MSHQKIWTREIRPKTIIATGVFAVVLVVVLWIAGVDDGAMQILLVPLLFGLVSYGSYLSNPREGEVSLHHGAIVGGLLMLIFLPCVVCKHSYETRGTPLPSSLFEVVMLGLSLLFIVPLGAGIGAMTAVIGDVAVRASHSLIRKWLAKDVKVKQEDSRSDSTDDLFGWEDGWGEDYRESGK
jgi:hypothetical protein